MSEWTRDENLLQLDVTRELNRRKKELGLESARSVDQINSLASLPPERCFFVGDYKHLLMPEEKKDDQVV